MSTATEPETLVRVTLLVRHIDVESVLHEYGPPGEFEVESVEKTDKTGFAWEAGL